MRKLSLLLSVGTILGLAVGAANAEMFPPNAPGSDQSPTGVGMQSTVSGFREVGSPYTGAQGQQYSPANAAYGSNPFSTPNPGTVNMRIDLRLDAFGQLGWWTGQNGQGFGTAALGQGNKENPYGIQGFVRIDLAVDGMTKGGIAYGGFAEIRENSGASVAASALSSGSSGENGTNTLYLRNGCLYVGTGTAGFFRIGQGSCADTNAMMETGLNDEIDTAGWDAQAGTLFPSAISPVWPWADGGNEYMPARIAYTSPVVAGFDLIASFAPNDATMFTGSACSATWTGCNAQSASSLASDIARWTNQFEVGLRYRNTMGPVGFAIQGTYTVSGQVDPSAGAAPGLRYNGLNMGMLGAEVSINKYIAIGANTLFGAYNGSWGLQNKPIGAQTSETTAIAWVAGARMTIPTMPLTIGGSYFHYKYQGQPGLPSARVSQGIDLAADYGLGPGMIVVAEYLWGQNNQSGYNFLTGACSAAATTCGSSTNAGANNTVSVQTFLLGMSLRF